MALRQHAARKGKKCASGDAPRVDKPNSQCPASCRKPDLGQKCWILQQQLEICAVGEQVGEAENTITIWFAQAGFSTTFNTTARLRTGPDYKNYLELDLKNLSIGCTWPPAYC